MRSWKIYLKGSALALGLAAALAFPSFAKEEREPVGHITLTISADVQAGDTSGTVDVSVDDGYCSVDSADFVNEKDYWVGGEKPKIEIWLSADSDYYFNKSGKSAFTFRGDKVKYVSSSTKYDKEALVLTVTLDKLDKEDEDLDVDSLYWDESNGIAHWEHLDIAKCYRVRLCTPKTGVSSDKEGIGTTYTVTENSFNFSDKFPKAGSYYFKVKAVDSKNNTGDWQDSPYIEVKKEDIDAWKGTWTGTWVDDETGRWYSYSDGSWPSGGWQYIEENWYFFGEDGYVKTGWIEWEGKAYYCDASGVMLASTVTPDGFTVGEDGARVD